MIGKVAKVESVVKFAQTLPQRFIWPNHTLDLDEMSLKNLLPFQSAVHCTKLRNVL